MRPRPARRTCVATCALLDACARGEIPGAVRLYGFAPACLSLGRMQPIDDVDLEACARDGVDVVRRPSGGRAVLHDQEVTYSVVCRSTDPVFGGRVLESCSRIHEAVAAGLATLGVHTDASRDAGQPPARRPRGSRPSLTASPAPRLTSCSTTAAASWSAAPRRGERERCCNTDRCCSNRHARPATCAAMRRRLLGGVGVRELLGREVSREELVDALATGFTRPLRPILNTPA